MKRKKTRANIAILDCCRNFRYKATRGVTEESTRGGTGESLPTFFSPSKSYHDKYSGVLIALACAPNHSVSDDGGNGHGRTTDAAFHVEFAYLCVTNITALPHWI